MKCAEVQNLIEEYVDGELTHSIELVEEHIDTCVECKAFYLETIELKNMLSGLDMLELPEDFEDSLHAKLVEASEEVTVEKKVVPFNKYRTPIKWIGSIAAIAIVAISVYQIVPFDDALDQNFASMESTKEMNTETTYTANIAADDVNGEAAEESMEMAETEEAAPDSVGVMMDTSQNKVRTLMSAQPILVSTGTVYHMNITGEAVETFIGNYDIRDLIIGETSFEFYIGKDEMKIFDDALKTTFGVTEEVFIDYSFEIQDIRIAYENQVEYVKELEDAYQKANESDKEKLKADLDFEKNILISYEVDLNSIEAYSELTQVIIILNKE